MHEVKLSPAAGEDIVGIREYISMQLKNPAAALSVVSRILARTRILRNHPEAGKPLSSVVDVQTDYRFPTSGDYLIFYRYEEEAVFVTRVLYGRRDYTRILFGDPPDSEAEPKEGGE